MHLDHRLPPSHQNLVNRQTKLTPFRQDSPQSPDLYTPTSPAPQLQPNLPLQFQHHSPTPLLAALQAEIPLSTTSSTLPPS